jgi:hypothetical protein
MSVSKGELKKRIYEFEDSDDATGKSFLKGKPEDIYAILDEAKKDAPTIENILLQKTVVVQCPTTDTWETWFEKWFGTLEKTK